MSKLIPRLYVNTIYDIDLEQLKKSGIRGIVTDLDNTLVGAKSPAATPELQAWLQKLRKSGFQVVVVSNNNKMRVTKFCEPLFIPFIYRAKKPTLAAFRKALSQMNLKAEQTAVIGDQMLTDVLGGNRMGLFTILVQPISLADEGFFTRMVNRRLEKAARLFMKRQDEI
ncbi:YqeG family HAD IIIA-type phosphatase [Paenibacillus thalictri]|uniref:YqeG family HAD IIIA-type phosphatase n=1 Tax=Paenibacillus thalictri TaxID=2527873 RepID=A0A4Q9DKU6_9BACL|nr:YqeG family HAD IIIA-type phosphatase [Paenibacillus thalictri]